MSIPETMSGVVLTGHGGPDKLEWRDDLAVPTPGNGEVLIRVLASSVNNTDINNTDINTRTAWYSKSLRTDTATAAAGAFDIEAADGAWSGSAIAGPIVELDVRTLYLRDLTLVGSTFQPDNVFSDLVRYIERGELQPAIAAEFPLRELARAQAEFLSKKYVGKIAIRVA